MKKLFIPALLLLMGSITSIQGIITIPTQPTTEPSKIQHDEQIITKENCQKARFYPQNLTEPAADEYWNRTASFLERCKRKGW